MEHHYEEEHFEQVRRVDDIFEPTLMLVIALILLGLGLIGYLS